MYSPIQLDIIRIFGNGQEERKKMGFDHYHDAHVVFIFKHTPELFPDVARVAKEKGLKITILYYTEGPHIIFNPIEFNLRNPERIPYNPTLPLIDQEESTLVELLNLFK